MATERSVLVRLNANPTGFIAGFKLSQAAVSGLRRELDQADRSIDRYSGRLQLLADIAVAGVPALTALGGVGIPVVTGLASAFGMAALGGATAIIAFQDVGDALSAMNKAHLEPTTANLEAADLAMRQLGPDAQSLVRYLSGLTDEWRRLRDAAAGGVLPGVEDAIDSLLQRAPEVQRILERVGDTVGDLLAEGGDSIASPRWDDFFTFIANDAPPAISSLAHATGDLAHAGAELWEAFGPLNNDFINWLERGADAIDEWATGLDQTQGFQEFTDFVEEHGPQAGETIAAIAMALLDIAEAAAPVGAATLPILEAVADSISVIADSNLGTPLLGVLALSRAMALFDRGLQTGPIRSLRTLRTDLSIMAKNDPWGAALTGGLAEATRQTERYERAAERTRQTLRRLAGVGGAIAGLAAVHSGLTDEIGLTNTVLGASAGLLAGGAWGAALGGAIGLVADFADKQELATVKAEELTDAIDAQTGAIGAQAYAAVGEALAGLAGDAEAAGVSLADVVAAAIEGGDAYDQLSRKLLAVIEAGTYIDEATGTEVMTTAAEAAWRLGGALDDQNGEVEKAIGLARGRKAGLDAAADADRRGAEAVDEQTTALERMNDALRRLNNFLTGRAALRDWEKSWLDLNKVVRENGEIWDRTRRKGIENLEALDATVENTIARVDDLREQGRNLAAQEFLGKQIERLRDFAARNPEARAEVQKLIDKLKDANRQKIEPKVKLEGLRPAFSEIDKLNDQLTILDRRVARPRVVFARDTNFNFGEGPGFAGGGWTGNLPKHQVAGVVHGREFVVPAPYAERDRAMLEKRYLPGYADGGFVDPARAVSVTVGGGITDRELELVGAAAGREAARHARPMFDHNVWNSDGDFERAQQMARRLSAKRAG